MTYLKLDAFTADHVSEYAWMEPDVLRVLWVGDKVGYVASIRSFLDSLLMAKKVIMPPISRPASRCPDLYELVCDALGDTRIEDKNYRRDSDQTMEALSQLQDNWEMVRLAINDSNRTLQALANHMCREAYYECFDDPGRDHDSYYVSADSLMLFDDDREYIADTVHSFIQQTLSSHIRLTARKKVPAYVTDLEWVNENVSTHYRNTFVLSESGGSRYVPSVTRSRVLLDVNARNGLVNRVMNSLALQMLPASGSRNSIVAAAQSWIRDNRGLVDLYRTVVESAMDDEKWKSIERDVAKNKTISKGAKGLLRFAGLAHEIGKTVLTGGIAGKPAEAGEKAIEAWQSGSEIVSFIASNRADDEELANQLEGMID